MSKIRSKMKNRKIMLGAVVCAMFGVFPSATAQSYLESFESGTLNGWGADTLNGSVGTVNTDRASAGIYSYGNSFTVSTNFAGWTLNSIVSVDARSIMTPAATSLTADVYSDWANPNGWGVYGNSIKLILNYQGGWTTVDPASGSLANGSFQTFTFDLTPYAPTIANPALSYSALSIAWFVGTWAGGQDNLDNGTQTFAVDNINVIQPAPEPGTAALAAMGGAAILFLRRRVAR